MQTKFLIIFFLFFCSCSRVLFQESMPTRIKSSSKIDNLLIGNYCYADSILVDTDTSFNSYLSNDFYKQRDSSDFFDLRITISSKNIVTRTKSGMYYDMNKIDTANLHRKEKSHQEKEFIGHYIVLIQNDIDTLLDLNKQDEIKFWKGKYYLNRKIDNEWDIYQLEFLNDSIVSINLTDDNDASWLKLDKKEWKPMFNYNIGLSDKEFKKFVNAGGFRTRYKIKKINAR